MAIEDKNNFDEGDIPYKRKFWLYFLFFILYFIIKNDRIYL
jgi:hypothetical protein